MVLRFRVKKRNSYDLYCRFWALLLHLQLQMSHSYCTQLINITKPFILTPVGPGHITNLTFIFLFSQPASPQPVLMSWGGLKERSDEPEEIKILLLSYWVGVSNKVSVSVVHTRKVIRKNTHFESQIQNSIQIKSDFNIFNGNVVGFIAWTKGRVQLHLWFWKSV